MAIHQYSLSDLLANGDISHYKYANGYGYTDLTQYKDTDWNLLLLPGYNGDGNNAFRSQSGLDVYNTGTLNGSEQYYHFKFNQFVHITKIECDVQMPSYLGDTGLLFMSGIKENGNSWSRYSLPNNPWGYWVEKGTNSYNAIEYWSSGDTSWHHMSVDYDVYTEYLCVMVYHVPCNIKNIVITTKDVIPSNGGGATHIAKVTGQLKDLSSNLSDILMVSGGGGGGLLVGETAYAGDDAGGIRGSGSLSADQSTGYAFGQGESGTNVSGGGGGLYGGYKSN